jgi:ketosteroid isomerase-like protein
VDAAALLQAQSACRDVILAAATAVDEQAYDTLVDLFCEDATLMRPNGVALQGRSEILASYLSKSPSRLTHHLVCNHQVQILPSGKNAHSRCRVLLYVSDKSREVTPAGRAGDAMHQVGTILDELVLTTEGWKIQKRQAWFDLFTES